MPLFFCRAAGYSIIGIFLCGISSTPFCPSLAAQDTKPATAGSDLIRENEERIAGVLAEISSLEFLDTPLEEAIDAISKRLNIQVKVDGPALEDFGIGLDTPITVHVDAIPLRSALNLLLKPLDLSWSIQNGVLLVSTVEELETKLTTKAYPVGDLTKIVVDDVESHAYKSLIDVVTATIEPDSWDRIGGPGSIKGLYGALVVSQTREVHEELDRLLKGLRSIHRGLQAEPRRVPPQLLLGGVAAPQIRAVLSQPMTAEFREVPLAQAIHQLQELRDIPILIDVPALEDFGIGTDTPVTLKQFRDLPLSSILHFLLSDLDLTWVVEDDVLMITTTEEAESKLQIGLYPVGDLVGPLAASETADCWGNSCDFDSLVETITASIGPDSWDSVGGPGAIAGVMRPPVLVVAQTEQVHTSMNTLLRELRRVRAFERRARGQE